MNKPVDIKTFASGCPHDCPSTCALEIDIIDGTTVGKVRGAKENTYTDGVICAKVARYADRVSHPDRLLLPKIRSGEKGGDEWSPIGWDDALDLVAEQFLLAEQRHGPEAVWPYYYAGTMGLVQRDSIHRLRHAKRYSNQFDTICVNPAFTGYTAGTGKLMGPRSARDGCFGLRGDLGHQCGVDAGQRHDPCSQGAEVSRRKDRRHRCLRQRYDEAGRYGALLASRDRRRTRCAVMHCLFRDGKADREYLNQYTDVSADLEAHLREKTPQWASEITGLTVEEIEAFATLLGKRPRSYFRMGYGFTRSRNGATNMHAATSIAAVLGAWKHEGGGAFHSNADIYRLTGET